jgi:hypothetical protein
VITISQYAYRQNNCRVPANLSKIKPHSMVRLAVKTEQEITAKIVLEKEALNTHKIHV